MYFISFIIHTKVAKLVYQSPPNSYE